MTAPDPNAQPNAGAAKPDDTTTGTPPAGAGPTDGGEPAGADALGEPGKKALDAMKAERNAARQQSRAVVDALADAFGKTPEQVREMITAGKLGELAPKPATTGGEPASAAADVQRQITEAKRNAAKAATARILKAELKAAAAGKLADPSDVALIDQSKFTVDDDGDVDPEEIAAAIDDLVKRKPHLAAQRGPTFGTADAGVRNGSKPGQLTEADLKRMTPEQIVAAHDKGQLVDLLGT